MDASTLKREVAEGVDLMVVRELTGGLCGFDSGFDIVDFFFFHMFLTAIRY